MIAFDADARELTAVYKTAVAAAIPTDVVCPLDAFWRDLAVIVEGYALMTERRQRRPPKRELEHWRKVASLTDMLGAELRKVRRDLLWSSRAARALPALWQVKNLADAHVAAYETLTDPKLTRGRSNPPREFLFAALLDLWSNSLGCDVRYSRAETKGGMPGGPLIRFLVAAVTPVLGDTTPTPHGFARIVDRERERRQGDATSSPPKIF
jgi:hypothetical protein